MDSYTVKAILSAVDKGFTSTMKQAEQTCESLSSKVKSGLGFGVLTGIGSQVFSSLTNGVSDLISEMNSSNVAWKTFEGNMEILGMGSDAIQSAKKEMQDYATATIYSASDMSATYSQLAAVGTKNTTELVKGFGGLAAAAVNPTQAMKTLSQQATQMAAKPYVQLMDFKLMLEQTPAGIAAVAKEMGRSTQQLVKDVQDGKVTTEEFFAAIEKAGNSEGFTKLATEYKSTDQALQGMAETLSNKLQPAWQALDQVGIDAVQGLIDMIGQIDTEALTAGIMGIVEDVKGAFNTIKGIVLDAWSAFEDTGAIDAAKEALNSCKEAINNVVTAISNSGIIETFATAFGEIAEQVAIVVDNIADFIAGLDEGTINTFAGAVTALFVAYEGYKVVSSATKKIKDFKQSASDALQTVKDLYDKIKNGGKSSDSDSTKPTQQSDSLGSMNIDNSANEIKAKWEGIANTVEKAGKSIREAMNGVADIIKSVGSSIADAARGIGDGVKSALEGVAEVFESVGKGISEAAKGIGTGIKSALEGVAEVIESIGTAIKSVLEGLAPVIESLGTALATVAKGIGEGISIALQGLGTALASIPATTWLAIAAAALAFGAALALVGSQGEGLQMVLNGVANVISSIAPIVQIVVNGIITALQTLPAIFQSVADVIETACDGISEVVDSLGDNISKVVDSVSDGMSQIIDSVGDAISGVLDSLAGIIDSIGEAALNAGKGFEKLANGLVKITNLNLLDLGASLLAVTTGLAGVTAMSGGLSEAGKGMKEFVSAISQLSISGVAASTAMLTISVAMQTLQTSLGQLGPMMDTASSSMETFATNAMTALATLAGSAVSAGAFAMTMAMLNASVQSGASAIASFLATTMSVASTLSMLSSNASSASTSISGISSAASTVGASLSSLGSVGSSAMQSLISSFREAQSEAKSAGTSIGNDLVKAVQSALKQLPSIASSAINSFTSALRSGQVAAYSAGVYIGMGLANGIRSQVSAVSAAAAQLAAAADRAIQAKARIGSPSKVTAKDGKFIGEGLVIGMESMYRSVEKAAAGLFNVPQLNDPTLAFAGINGQLSQDYNYYHEAEYTINVPLDVDGKQFAKATATYTQEELDRQSKFKNRLLGVK